MTQIRRIPILCKLYVDKTSCRNHATHVELQNYVAQGAVICDNDNCSVTGCPFHPEGEV